MSDSRFTILEKLRTQRVEAAPLPEVVDGEWIDFDDLQSKFAEMVETAGGACKELPNEEALAEELKQYPQWQEAQQVYSSVASVPGNVELQSISDPRDLETLDFVIHRGHFAVAENGAIWLTDTELDHRVLFFITQFLVLLVDKDAIVPTMHQAYARAQTPQPGFGLFLSGPSKTADIEQSLVIGAHGCRELQVYLV